MTNAFLAILATATLGQTAKVDERLDLMKAKAAEYRFERDGGRKSALKLQAEPAFRMGKQPADDIEEGAIFFWLDDTGRPEAAVQIFLIKNSNDPLGLWIHEFISLSPEALAGTRGGVTSWSPRKPGLEFHPLPGAPRPSATVSQRGRQMRALAQQFHASDKFKEKTWADLRLLPTPIARFGKEGTTLIDGSLFTFVMGTDPEAFLFIEARPGNDGPEWHYAFAPMTCYDLKGTLAGKNVWDLPYRRINKDPALPYFIRTEKP
ncbi:MAG: hypothetical protein JWN86_1598 [Planctomycetota bacterium]|nr:hypothetical protein [Planctomycetota bacterium]